MSDFAVEVREPVRIWTGKVMLDGRLYATSEPAAAVVIRCVAPGSVPVAPDEVLATEFSRYRIALLTVSLLTTEEEEVDDRNARYRHDAEFMAQRTIDVAQWVAKNRPTAGLPIGYCGYSITAAGALIAAVQRPDLVSAIVAINGRTDLAIDYLRTLRTPTLLSVNDMPVLRMNREALSMMKGEKRIEIVHGTSEEPITTMVQKSGRWFADRLAMVEATA